MTYHFGFFSSTFDLDVSTHFTVKKKIFGFWFSDSLSEEKEMKCNAEPLGTPDENAWRESVMNDKSKDNWCVYTLKGKKKRRIVLSGKGPGGLKEFNEALKEDQIQFGGFRVTGVDRKGACTSVRSKFVFVTWVGPKVSVVRRAGVPSLSVAIGKYFEGRHLDLKAMGDLDDLNAATIEKQLRAVGGSHQVDEYDFTNKTV